jgi:hypothetical protein
MAHEALDMLPEIVVSVGVCTFTTKVHGFFHVFTTNCADVPLFVHEGAKGQVLGMT